MKTKEDLFNPDTLWSVYGIKDREDFDQKIHLTPKFHGNVTEDIIKEFETIKYLLSFSYYYSPFLDEAVTKSLIIIETAIKIRAKQLNIPLKIIGRQNRERDKRLSVLIDEVLQQTSLEYLKSDFDRARKIRNGRVHKDSHTFMGMFGYPINNIRLFINLINQVFLSDSEIERISENRNRIDEVLKSYKNGLFILEYNSKKILIEGVLIHKYIEYRETKLLIILADPVLTNAFEAYTKHLTREPLLITLKNFDFATQKIIGKGLDDSLITIEPTNKKENLTKYKSFCEERNKVSETNMQIYKSSIYGKGPWEMERIMFEHCWS